MIGPHHDVVPAPLRYGWTGVNIFFALSGYLFQHLYAESLVAGVFSWSAARLFVQQAIGLGGKLSRETLLAAMAKVDNWTCNNLHSRQHVGPRHTGDGWRFLQVKGGKYVPIGGTNYKIGRAHV